MSDYTNNLFIILPNTIIRKEVMKNVEYYMILIFHRLFHSKMNQIGSNLNCKILSSEKNNVDKGKHNLKNILSNHEKIILRIDLMCCS